jgi:hypothetical protein
MREEERSFSSCCSGLAERVLVAESAGSVDQRQ